MFLRTKLACSFCGKRAAEVAKLVAGPNVYICDVCAAQAHRIMSDPTAGAGMARPQPRVSLWSRVRAWLVGARRSHAAPGAVS